MGIAPRVKPGLTTPVRCSSTDRRGLFNAREVENMEPTNTTAAEARNTTPAEETPQSDRPERCQTCTRAELCAYFWGGNFCAVREAAQWDTFTDAEIARAVELMIAPEDLTIRGAALALFAVFGYTPADVREQLDSGEYLNGGAVFDGLASDTPRILYPDEA